MARKRIFRQLYLHFLFVIVLSLGLSFLLAFWMLRSFSYDQARADLSARALLAQEQVRRALAKSPGDAQEISRRLGALSNTRITVVLADGTVVADSLRDPAEMENHADRPEIRTALGGRVGAEVRYSRTAKKNMVYVAVPVWEGEGVLFAVRTSMPEASVAEALGELRGRMLLLVLAVALAATGVSLLVSRKLSRPLEEMRQGALRFARGDLSTRLDVPDSEEMGGLAEALNDMEAQLHERIRTISRQRGEQEAILTSMAEGVLAVDAAERVISLNQAACGMLGFRMEKVLGRSIQEAVRNTVLHNLVAAILSGRGSSAGGPEGETQSVLETSAGRFLQASGAILRDAGGERIGAVIVLNDITRLRELESHRREFVANVSHELRTPLTSIKGFVETLRDGALGSPEDARRFLGIIARQVDQLNAIIEDLLVLSRIEQNGERNGVKLEPRKVREVLESAVEVCSSRAVEKDISIGISCDGDLTGRMHFPLLTQAVVNLLDNAIQFSNPGGAVQVEAGREEGGLYIRVEDQGCGIPEDHIPRLTERFYRVDRARSRKAGGTGLGLAIVKHIVQSHGGTLSVRSTPGRGSTFSLHLPHAGR